MERYRILIIDDDEDQHEILGEYLSLAGYVVDHSYDGAAGLQALEQRGADLVLLDVRMPGMDGFETLAEMQERPALRDLPVLMLTSLNMPHLKVKGLELGAEDYLTKPCNKPELLARVRAALRRAPRYKRDLAAMEGNLSDLPLAELVQTLELAGRHARVALHELRGELVLGAGSTLWASYGEFTGRAALERLILLNRGLFSVTFAGAGAVPASEEAHHPLAVQGALMGALTLLDEVIAAVAVVGALEELVELVDLDEQDSQAPALIPVRSLGPQRLGELIVRMSGELQDNVATLVALHRKDKLRVLA